MKRLRATAWPTSGGGPIASMRRRRRPGRRGSGSVRYRREVRTRNARFGKKSQCAVRPHPLPLAPINRSSSARSRIDGVPQGQAATRTCNMGDLVQLPGWTGAQRFRLVPDVMPRTALPARQSHHLGTRRLGLAAAIPCRNESEDHDRFSTSALCHELFHPIALHVTVAIRL